MGQHEVLQTLRKKKWKTSREISEKLGLTETSVNHSLRVLRKRNELDWKIIIIKLGNNREVRVYREKNEEMSKLQ